MQEMREADESPDDTAGLRRRFARDGYLLIRNLIGRNIAGAIAEDALSTMRDGRYVAGEGESHHAVELPEGAAERTLSGALQRIELLHELGWHPRIRELATALLGPRAYVQPKKVLEALFPARLGDESLHVHRDNLGGPWCRDMITFRVALREATQETGSVAVLGGSHDYHHCSPRAAGDVPNSHCRLPEYASPEWVVPTLSPGDVVLFHCYTAHKVLSNGSDRVQLSAEYRWQSDDHPVHISALLPYRYFSDHPDIPGWNELTVGWRDPRWCAYPDTVETIYSRWPDGMSGSVPPSQLFALSPHAREHWRPEIVESDLYRTTPFELPGTFRAGQPPMPSFNSGR
ncbi:phytanoyl-CoA dioxygenase family protein [Pseudonocardia charpentierae]|uniref:Phytanoyl-CoA dioxygenase family protein n=1 Tax=Pseudonocardia charpentierae TaxID=3075545 RepID=A0ABU2N3M1_9PSEU|nr:phytanoyl-CoA dioxygenase family protein [Pseudonocardia sp. DSM 45834]MDT0348118.1 phytanoyl-CoA dioxygenase family protein [Pseudonocardia sp. DSM 45834]